MGIIKRCGYYVLSLGLLSTGFLGVLSNNAYAVSDIDDKVQITNQLVHEQSTGIEDVTSDWYPQIIYALEQWRDTQGDPVKYGAILDKLEENVLINKTGWAVIQNQYNGYNILIFDHDAEINFGSNVYGNATNYYIYPSKGELITLEIGGGNYMTPENFWNYMTISTSNGDPEGLANIYGWYYQSASTNTQRHFLEIASNKVNYPTGYEGVTVPKSSFEPPVTEVSIKPQPLLTVKDKIIEVNQTKILEYILRENNILWQNKSGYLTYMIWELDENDNTIGEAIHLTENLIESREFSYTFEEYGRYRLAVGYSWPSVIPMPIEPEGIDISYDPFGFTMNIDGRIYNQGWDDEACTDGYCLGDNENLVDKCISETFPYVDPGGCIGQFNSFIKMLTFRTPEADALGGGVFHDAVNGCRELQVLDDWILRPNQVVCPMIPSEIRNTITPFVTFGFGLMAMTFIARRQGIRSLD